MGPKPSAMYGGIAFILVSIVFFKVDVSLAQYGMSQYEACEVLCGGNDYIDFRRDKGGYWNGLSKPWYKPKPPRTWDICGSLPTVGEQCVSFEPCCPYAEVECSKESNTCVPRAVP